MESPPPEVQKVAALLQGILTTSGLDLRFHILACNGQVQPEPGLPASAGSGSPPSSSEAPPAKSPILSIEFTGPDTPALIARNGELLLAFEHLATQVLRLDPAQHDLVSFDADGFKAGRDRELQRLAEAAIESVRVTERPYAFPPMTSRERRLLHLVLAPSGLPTASDGVGPRRHVVLYPEGHAATQVPSETTSRAHALRNSFRRR